MDDFVGFFTDFLCRARRDVFISNKSMHFNPYNYFQLKLYSSVIALTYIDIKLKTLEPP